ncbi:hypothetical protein ACP4OV_012498 [Aristida adscensionis]
MEREIWLLSPTLAVSLLYFLTTLRRRHGHGRLPPAPRPLPILGNALELRDGSLARAHGPVMRLELGPTHTAVVVSSLDAAAEAFTKHDKRLAARYTPDAVHVLGWADRSIIYLPSSDPL